jgi:opacity protein-like surface antigen
VSAGGDEVKTMKTRRLFPSAALLAALLLSVGATAAAEEAGPFEVTLSGGASFGSRVATGTTKEVKIGNAGAWGLRAAWAASPSFRLEASWAHASADLLERDVPNGGSYAASGSVTTDAWDLDAVYDFGGKSTRGSLGLGLGAMQISPTIGTLSDSETRFTLNVTAGVRQWLTPHLAVRLDGRYRWRDGKSRIGTFVCDGECKPFTTNWYSSAELTGGVTWRF